MHLVRVEAGFFGGLAQRHPQNIGIAVGMSAGLEPLVLLDVMHDQRLAEILTHHPGRAGNMRGQVFAIEHIGVGLHEGACTRHEAGLIHETRVMPVE